MSAFITKLITFMIFYGFLALVLRWVAADILAKAGTNASLVLSHTANFLSVNKHIFINTVDNLCHWAGLVSES